MGYNNNSKATEWIIHHSNFNQEFVWSVVDVINILIDSTILEISQLLFHIFAKLPKFFKKKKQIQKKIIKFPDSHKHHQF